jgi:hypothetical protein
MSDGHLSGGFDEVIERVSVWRTVCGWNGSGTQETCVLKANLVALSASDGHCNEECAGS